MKTDSAVLDATREYQAAAADRARHSPQGLKAREEDAEARLLQAQETHAAEQERCAAELDEANRCYAEAKATLIETAGSFVEAREALTQAEGDLLRMNARARKLDVPVPPYQWLSRDVKNDTALRHLGERIQRATRDGLFGAR